MTGSDHRNRTGKRAGAPRQIAVERIRPEDGLGRRRDRAGHRELCQSIEQFGVLTPITVRPAPDGSGDFLLIKGQGRTLACHLLGLKTIPAIVVDVARAETEKVQQFLVENVARLKMAAIDRALLIARARRAGEETAAVAKRFGVQPQTVRRLEAQLEGVSAREVAALRGGEVNLALHAVIAKHTRPADRAAVVEVVAGFPITAREADELLMAVDWRGLTTGDVDADECLQLLRWALQTLSTMPKASPRERIRELAILLPATLASTAKDEVAG